MDLKLLQYFTASGRILLKSGPAKDKKTQQIEVRKSPLLIFILNMIEIVVNVM